MNWATYILILAVSLAINSLTEARYKKSHDSDSSVFRRNFRLLKRLIKAQHVRQNVAQETVPLTNEEISQMLDKIENTEISDSCLVTENCAMDFMFNYNFILAKINEKSAFLEFQFETNITDSNEKEMNDLAPISNRFQSLVKKLAFKFLQNSKDWSPELNRMLFLAAQGIVFNDPEDVKKLSELSSQLESIYAKAKVCRNNFTAIAKSSNQQESDEDDTIKEECLNLDPGITDLLANSRDYDELLWAWKGWHDASGKKMRSIFTETVQIQNKAARDNNYTDLSEYWISDFEDDNFEKNADALFNKIQPLYQQVHAYVREKLRNFYGINYPVWHNEELIPAHLLGNMWAQTWENIYDLVKPFPDVKETSLTEVLVEKKYTPIKMFEEAEKFFVSIGLFEMTPEFWKYSMIERPVGRDVVCHASATDLYNGRDFRIKMCTTITDDQFNTIHHEMGHIEYYMAYSNQPTIFKTGANSAFHEAIGYTISLSVQTPKHFKAIDIIDDDTLTPEANINFLMKMALKKLVFLPFGYFMDKWRWDVFRGKINQDNYNQRWWDMRKEFQGIEPPIDRSEDDFDPGAKYHIASYVPYARYFISHFLQFQFYKSLCDHAGHEGPLHTCDFYESKEAGFYLRKMLELGASKHWSHALKIISGETTVSADAVLEYFKPLQEWLEKENTKISNSKLVM